MNRFGCKIIRYLCVRVRLIITFKIGTVPNRLAPVSMIFPTYLSESKVDFQRYFHVRSTMNTPLHHTISTLLRNNHLTYIGRLCSHSLRHYVHVERIKHNNACQYYCRAHGSLRSTSQMTVVSLNRDNEWYGK